MLALASGASILPAQQADSHASLLAADRAASLAIHQSGLATALDSLLADSAALLLPGLPVLQGRGTIAQLIRSQSGLDTLSIQWQPLHAETSGAGDFGITWGVLLVTPRDRASAEPVRIGRYIAGWRRAGGAWRLAGLVLSGALPQLTATESAPASRALQPRGPLAHFIKADLDFAALAKAKGAANAFGAFAARDGVTFAASGELNRGPEQIRHALAANTDRWRWWPVYVAGAAAGDLGLTVGEAVITEEKVGGETYYGKYLTAWRRAPDGKTRFIADAGNVRPPE